jgi:hypothetical protein
MGDAIGCDALRFLVEVQIRNATGFASSSPCRTN